MNQEQRQIQLEKINKLEDLLAYAVKTGDIEESERISCELQALVDSI